MILLSNNFQIRKNQNQMRSLDKKNIFYFFFFLNVDCVFFFTIKTKNKNSENEKKFINVILNGEKPNIRTLPKIKGAKNITKNLLLRKFTNFNPYELIEFKIFFSAIIIFK